MPHVSNNGISWLYKSSQRNPCIKEQVYNREQRRLCFSQGTMHVTLLDTSESKNLDHSINAEIVQEGLAMAPKTTWFMPISTYFKRMSFLGSIEPEEVSENEEDIGLEKGSGDEIYTKEEVTGEESELEFEIGDLNLTPKN
ncbi:hypothetical protein BO71DRAFT_425907 [Aspergillus ellipticus CBS 707.79]|uniref:Uncharacterized protein n=1 Tax=Aspergillus ellipticus CBS 707.79 TaxID=1448320 RepID=A0A319DM65_9EURO|nr:hypothetical protein BO71DRAFT_425907 [Aspergillus ellipticus CBS 707.79]